LIEAADIDMPSGLAAADLLIREFAPTAIVATSDVHAVAALKALSSNGIAVPEACRWSVSTMPRCDLVV